MTGAKNFGAANIVIKINIITSVHNVFYKRLKI
jgi:hypothetical protein